MMVELNDEIKNCIKDLDCDENIKIFLEQALENELDLNKQSIKPGSAAAVNKYKELIKDNLE